MSRPILPARRLRKLPWTQARFVALAIELADTDPRGGRIATVGTVPIQGRRIDLGGAAYQLVEPGDRARSAIALHGVRPEEEAMGPGSGMARLSIALDRHELPVLR